MKRKAIQSGSASGELANPETDIVRRNNHREPAYTKPTDARKRPIRGLWERNGRFYAQLAIEEPDTGKKAIKRVPLVDAETQAPVATVAQAMAALARLKVARETHALPILRQCPKFSDYVETYLTAISAGDGAKKPRTVAKERLNLALWKAHLGEVRLDKIRKPMIVAFRDKRRAKGIGNRTLNLDIITLRNVLKRAQDDGWLRFLPTEGLKPERTTTAARGLVTLADLELICEAAAKPLFCRHRLAQAGEKAAPLKNARQFADYIKLMAFCGSRRDETLQIRWADVDFKRRILTIGATGDTKNREARTVDFNRDLERHLQAMHKRRAPDTDWLFPSPQRGEKDIHAKTWRQAFDLAQAGAVAELNKQSRAAKAAAARQEIEAQAERVGKISFHDCRHHFISMCVMAGIDFMTIARWVGHKDGGVLIGKVYGHLADSHRKAMAEKLVFKPAIVELQEAAI